MSFNLRPFTGVVFSCILSWLLGYWLNSTRINIIDSSRIFSPIKSPVPQVAYFTSSLCPNADQFENELYASLSKIDSNISLEPHYLFEKVTDLDLYCQGKTIDTGCYDEKNYLQSTQRVFYTAPLGKSAARQNIREICAWNQAHNQSVWQRFVQLINQNCTIDNVDSCWEQQGLTAGIDTDQVTQCFNQNAFTIMDQEIIYSQDHHVNSAPWLIINNSHFPPPTARDYTTVNGKSINHKQIYSQGSMSMAICSSWQNPPTTCTSTALSTPAITNIAPGQCKTNNL